MIDKLSKLRTFLITDTGDTLFALVGTRVWKRVAKHDFKNTVKGIVIHEEGSAGDIAGSSHLSTMVLKCYGGTDDPDDAERVGAAVWDKLQAAVSNTNQISRANLLTAQDAGPEAPSGYPVYMVRFRVLFTE